MFNLCTLKRSRVQMAGELEVKLIVRMKCYTLCCDMDEFQYQQQRERVMSELKQKPTLIK